MTRKLPQVRHSRDVLEVVNRIHQQLDFQYPPFRFEDFLAIHPAYKVFEVDLPLGLDGRIFLTPDGDRRTIHLRKDNSRTRIRFTLAHELMHAELHFPSGQLHNLTACRTSDRHRDRRRNALEREADAGAAALLMPLKMIDRYVPQRHGREYPDHVVKHLARLFLVSEIAMRIQLKNYATHRDSIAAP